MHQVIFSSKRADWATPQALFDELNREFGFTLDVAADDTNAKCARYYTQVDDGLLSPWSGVVWCNPPYGPCVGDWVEKAYREAGRGVTSVLLLPARTDTAWFHAYVLNKADIRFVRGRLKFSDGRGSAPFPSMIVIFRPG